MLAGLTQTIRPRQPARCAPYPLFQNSAVMDCGTRHGCGVCGRGLARAYSFVMRANLLAAIVIAVAVVVTSFIAFPRYELRSVGGTRPIAYRIDRWSGAVSVVEARPDGFGGPLRATVREATDLDAFDAGLADVRREATSPRR